MTLEQILRLFRTERVYRRLEDIEQRHAQVKHDLEDIQQRADSLRRLIESMRAPSSWDSHKK